MLDQKTAEVLSEQAIRYKEFVETWPNQDLAGAFKAGAVWMERYLEAQKPALPERIECGGY